MTDVISAERFSATCARTASAEPARPRGHRRLTHWRAWVSLRASRKAAQAARAASTDEDMMDLALDAVLYDPRIGCVGVVVWAFVVTRLHHEATLGEILQRLPFTPRAEVVCALRSLVAEGHLTSSMAPRGEGQ